jgi:hypothetical protein
MLYMTSVAGTMSLVSVIVGEDVSVVLLKTLVADVPSRSVPVESVATLVVTDAV